MLLLSFPFTLGLIIYSNKMAERTQALTVLLFYSFLYVLQQTTDAVETTLRLMDGDSQYEGRLEVYLEGQWGTFCDNNWRDHPGNAKVVCRQLGYRGGDYELTYLYSTEMFIIDQLRCNGTESNIGECQFQSVKNRDCSGKYDSEILITCEADSSSSTTHSIGEIRLMNGKDEFEGRVEIFSGGHWLSICDYGWGKNDAKVACRELGFNGGKNIQNAEFGEGYGSPFQSTFRCLGNENKLADCGRGNRRCNQKNTAGVVCDQPHYGKSCGGQEQCLGNSVCIKTEGKSICQCKNESMMYWNATKSQCVNKTYHESVCYRDTPGTCGSNLLCTSHPNGDKCLCNETKFWDDNKSKCILKSNFNETCLSDISNSCISNLVCQNHFGHSKCICNDTNMMFWDERDEKCLTKSVLNEKCLVHILDSCFSNLVCRMNTNHAICVCNDTKTMFWHERDGKCLTKFSFEETCSVEASGSCASNLMCKKHMNQSQCVCNDTKDMYWDGYIEKCFPRKSFNGLCNADIKDECKANLVCRKGKSSNFERCLCSEMGASLWDIEQNKCISEDSVYALYVPEPHNFSMAHSYCNDIQNGSLATLQHLENIFTNCTQNIRDIWLHILPGGKDEIGGDNNFTCSTANMEHNISILNCTQERHFVCILKKSDMSTGMCKGFPKVPVVNSEEFVFHSGISGGALVAIFLFIIIGTIVVILIYYRKRKRLQKRKTHGREGTDATDSRQFHNSIYGSVPPPDDTPLQTFATRSQCEYDYTTTVPNGSGRKENDNIIYENYSNNKGNLVANDENDLPGYMSMQSQNSYVLMGHTNKQKETENTRSKLGENYNASQTQDYDTFGVSPDHNEMTLDDYSHSKCHDITEDDYNTFAQPNVPCAANDTYDHVRSDTGIGNYDAFKGDGRVHSIDEEVPCYMNSEFP